MKKTIRIITIVILLFLPSSSSFASENLYSNALSDNQNIPKGSLDSAKNAIRNRNELKIAFVGDSITKSAYLSDINDSYVEKVTSLLKRRLPNINIQYQNFGIGSTYTSIYLDPLYKGFHDSTSTGNGFYTPWSVEGKSWKDTVKDYNPDLVVFAFGMNDAFGNNSLSDENMANNLRLMIDDVRSWASNPSVVLLTSIYPTLDTTKYNERNDTVDAVVRATRIVSYEKGVALADANRLFGILRDGKDQGSTLSNVIRDVPDYPTGWTGDTSYFTPNQNELDTTNAALKSITNNKLFYNGIIEMDLKFSVNGDPGVMWIDYRKSDLGKMTVLVSAGAGDAYVRIYSWDQTTGYRQIQEVHNLNIPTNTLIHINIEAKENRHIVSVNGLPVIDVKTYSTLNSGQITLKIPPIPCLILNYVTKYRDPIIQNGNSFSELELLGALNRTTDGNGINHPTPLSHEMAYVPSFYGIINELAR